MPSRRTVIRALAAGAAGALLRPYASLARAPYVATPLARAIPSSGEKLPVVGLGTWITFNVGDDPELRDESAAIMQAFFEAGGRVIDSSPMYGSSQEVVGYGLAKLDRRGDVFSADKVWIGSGDDGPAQIEEILATRPIDFVQVSYNVLDRDVEERILPLAREKGIAVLINRPFRQGALTRDVVQHPLPAFAAEIGAATWGQLLLKFIISHPAVTCVIPATTQPAHAAENVAAATGELPDEPMRKRIADYVGRL